MIPSPEVDKLLELLIAEYEEDNGFKYTKSFDDSGFIEEEIKTTIEVYQDQMDSKIFDLLLNLSWYATDRCIYFALHKKDAELAKGELSRAIAYAYWATNYGAKACKCFGGRLEHRGNHPKYSKNVGQDIADIRQRYESGDITRTQARKEVSGLQKQNKKDIMNKDADNHISKSGCSILS